MADGSAVRDLIPAGPPFDEGAIVAFGTDYTLRTGESPRP
jgi:hypothetical protein